MKFIAALLAVASLAGGAKYVHDNATVIKCHDKKILFVKYGVECKEVKRFA